jgi:hypothetical protein
MRWFAIVMGLVLAGVVASGAAYAQMDAGLGFGRSTPGLLAAIEPPLATDAACGCQEESCYSPDMECGLGGCWRQCEPWALPQPWLLSKHGIKIGGWIDQGVGVLAYRPADRFNGPVTFVDRDAEWQVNQVWLYMEREVNTGGYGWDIGGRVDFIYGTDAMFTQAIDGLEADWDQTERFYQAALPQFYVDVAYDDWTVRMGHFFTILGYERVAAPENFFYSHAYTMQYGEPFTHTGALVMRDIGPFSLSAGLHRGNNQFDDTDGLDALNFLGGASWTNWAENLSLAFAVSATEDGPGVKTTIYSLVGSWDVTRRLTYVIQHDYGQSAGLPNRSRTVEWYGLNQYLLYEINPCWAAGMRLEWFRDDDGVRVVGLRDGNLATGPFVGDFYEVTAGLNWMPHPNVIVRPELRWDWFEGSGMPYDAGERDDQFLWACDVILTY